VAFTNFYFSFWSRFIILESVFGVAWSVGIVWLVGDFMIGGFLLIICNLTNGQVVTRVCIFTIFKGALFLSYNNLCSGGERLWLEF
jgi:hypothetical protein